MLEKWLPFKFRRRRPEDKTSASAPAWPASSLPDHPFWQSMFADPFFRDPFARAGDLERWFGDFSPARFAPSIEVADEDRALRVTAELPGMSRDDVELSIDNDVLTIRGQKKNVDERKEKGVFRTERYYGFVQRSVPLPAELDVDKAEASFDKGVLTVRLPKKKRQKALGGRSIPIKA